MRARMMVSAACGMRVAVSCERETGHVVRRVRMTKEEREGKWRVREARRIAASLKKGGGS